MRASLVPVLAGALLLSVTGCSPEQRPLVAVYVDQRGVPYALLRSCDDDGRVRGPGLRGTLARGTEGAAPDEARGSAPAEPLAEDSWTGWDTRGHHEAADFPLFAPPSSWSAETRGPQSLQPAHSYELAFADPDDSYAYTASVTFDARELAALPTGQVLTGQGAMPSGAFEDLARQACRG
ncbi:hypothetical protein AB0A69_29650 [Streptomyces sp. NPDC045431]|uniref:hypothetical protein n=1 Tax=Streptomyces sp. NPDC045431 TaxID=3155613 RepID=UPI003401E9B1